MTEQEIKAEIRSLEASIQDMYNRSQWMSTSQLDRVDDMVGNWENRIKELNAKLEKIKTKAAKA